jgi:serine/threonine protein kinase
MTPSNVLYMVFDYHEYDLKGILKTPEIRLTQDQIKSWSYQLLEGTHYMHLNKIIHRDLKTSNILISKSGQLKIADLGLARSWNAEMKNLTNGVVTRWYRPIELLLGARKYSPKIDMWSVGCIIAEMIRRNVLLKGGDSEFSQLNVIFQTCGHPDVNDWPDIRRICPLWSSYEPAKDEKLLPNRLAKVLTQRLPNPEWMTDNAVVLIQNLLTHNPEKRWSASEGLRAEYFWETPAVKMAHELSMELGVEHVHELKISNVYAVCLKGGKVCNCESCEEVRSRIRSKGLTFEEWRNKNGRIL